MSVPLFSLPAVIGFHQNNVGFFWFTHPFHAGENIFINPARNAIQFPCIGHLRDFSAITFTRFSPTCDLCDSTVTDTGTFLTVPKINLLSFVGDFQNINATKAVRLL